MWVLDLDPNAAALSDDEAEGAGCHEGLADLIKRVLDRHAAEVDEAPGGDIEVAARSAAEVAPVAAALERDAAANRDKALEREIDEWQSFDDGIAE